MKNLKKTLSVLLAALMILSLFAVSAFAAGKITEAQYNELRLSEPSPSSSRAC